jgi:hypothetical protein
MRTETERTMKILILVCSVALLHSTLYGEMKPQGGDAVFRIYSSGRGGGTGTSLYMKTDQPLMVISTVADVQVTNDGKAVRLTMTQADARKFAEITRQHPNEMLILVGRGSALQAIQVGSPITNGVLEFRYPQEHLAADYVKYRFRLK